MMSRFLILYVHSNPRHAMNWKSAKSMRLILSWDACPTTYSPAGGRMPAPLNPGILPILLSLERVIQKNNSKCFLTMLNKTLYY